MKIATTSDVWRLTAIVVSLASAIVTLVTLLFDPRELWRREILLGLAQVVLIATPVTYYLGRKLQDNHRLSQELTRLLHRDRLTDVSTRDFFFERWDAEQTSSGVMLMVDIDHFKAVNDSHGHDVGDQVIRRVAAILSAGVGADDIVCRFGGEEFVIFLDGVEASEGAAVAERLRAAVRAGTIARFDLEVEVTISIGAALKRAQDTAEAAIKAADEALYRAKFAGRDRVDHAWRSEPGEIGIAACR